MINLLIQIIILIVLILLNGIFASSEIAFLSVNKTHLNKKVKEGNKRAIKVKKLIENPSSFLATIQIGITLAGFLASAFAAEAFADEIVLGLSSFAIAKEVLKPIVVVIVTLILSYFTLVFGELVPKRIALNYSESIAFGMVNMITGLMKVTYPFVWLLTASTNMITKIFGITDKREEKLTEEEIRMIIAEGRDVGAIEEGEKELIEKVFQFNDILVKKIMTPREKIVAIDVNMPKERMLEIIKECKYTRIPVYDTTLDHIIGIFNVKDIIHKYSEKRKFSIREMLSTPMIIYEDEIVDDVFRLMQKNRQSLAIVLNDKQQLVGILSTEDAIEEIVGNIFDEYDEIEETKKD